MVSSNKMCMVVLSVLITLSLLSHCTGYPSRGRSRKGSYSGSCSAYRRAYYKLKQSIETCYYVNNYGCQIDPYSRECNFRCIPLSQWCDGIVQCPLADDELNCPVTVPVTTAPPPVTTTVPVTVPVTT